VNKRVLVTGASGYLASNLVAALADIDCTVVRFSRQADLVPVRGAARIVDLQGDVRDPAVWDRVTEAFDIVYHLAAQTSVYLAEKDVLADLKANVFPLLSLFDHCRTKGQKPHIVFAGTATEVGLPECLPVDESHVDRPVTIYDVHKLMAEEYLKLCTRLGIVTGCVLRLTNVFGPGPKSSSSDRGVLNMMIRRALAGQTLTVYGDGDWLRDFIYVDDVVAAFLKAGAGPDSVNGCHFVVGSGVGHTVNEMIELTAHRVATRTGQPTVAIEHTPPPEGLSPIEQRNFVADSSLFSQQTGWRATASLEQGIDRTVEHYLGELQGRQA